MTLARGREQGTGGGNSKCKAPELLWPAPTQAEKASALPEVPQLQSHLRAPPSVVFLNLEGLLSPASTQECGVSLGRQGRLLFKNSLPSQ